MTMLAEAPAFIASDSIPKSVEAEMVGLREKNVDELFGAIDLAMGVTVQAINRAAAAIRVLEDMGIDVANHESFPMRGLRKFTYMVAHGKVIAEVVTEFFMEKAIVNKVATLPLDQQSRVVREGVDVVEFNPDGSSDVRRMGLKEICASDRLDQVIHDGHLAGPPAQAVYASRQQTKTLRGPRKQNEIVEDISTGCIWLGGPGGICYTDRQMRAFLKKLDKNRTRVSRS